ncbi:hypothetical protein [Leptospira licerasiae]|uniref:hypothetical protein n=1 Tax=Leptospira licerasiae TaxID=447106 RepID=UPI001E362654|nr:hypothetical protein [Leptospira licerasiae]
MAFAIFAFCSIAILLPSIDQLSASSENYERPLRVSWEEEAQDRIEASFNQIKDSNLSTFVLSEDDIKRIDNSTSLVILLAEEAFEFNLTHKREASIRPVSLVDNIKLDNTSEKENSSSSLGDFESISLILSEMLTGKFFKEKNPDQVSSLFRTQFPNSNSILLSNHFSQTNHQLKSFKKFRRYLAKLTHSDPDGCKINFSFPPSCSSKFKSSFFLKSFSSLSFQRNNKFYIPVGVLAQTLFRAWTLNRIYKLTLPLDQKEQLA